MSSLIRRFDRGSGAHGPVARLPGGRRSDDHRAAAPARALRRAASVDLTTATEWHLKKDDVGGGSGRRPA